MSAQNTDSHRTTTNPDKVYPNDPRQKDSSPKDAAPATHPKTENPLDEGQQPPLTGSTGGDDGGESLVSGMPREKGGERDHQHDPKLS